MLKEEIKANATIFKASELQGVYPVNNIMQINRYREQERNSSGQNFNEALEQAQKAREEAKVPKDTKLRMMGGLNQYNRQGIEFCYYLSSDTDFRA